jgi:hypothetical protein
MLFPGHALSVVVQHDMLIQARLNSCLACYAWLQVQEIALSSLEEISQPDAPADAVREAGARVWVKLRLGMDYDLLVAQPQRLAAFKSDIAHWLREVVGDTKYIYGTGGVRGGGEGGGKWWQL